MSGNELKRAAASMEQRETVQVKVCGLTRVEEAVACAQAGAAAIGCVFYAESPRCVTAATARAIRRALPPEVVQRLRREGLFVIKALFADRAPGMETASQYSASAYLVECGRGALPGGNAQEWDWSRAGPFAERHPLILAGGLTPENAAQAVRAALPDAVDVSSGVEAGPGRKNIRNVEQFIAAVATASTRRRIFA